MSKKINRAEIVDQNFLRHVRAYEPAPGRVLPAGLKAEDLRALFESQLISRHLDLMARELRLQDRVYYTIGSSGHEGNALLGRLTRHTDPAFLHYRSGAFVMERSRKIRGIDCVYDAALSFAASAQDPASGGRHKVWGSKPLWIVPQTSTIASQLPKAVGTALAIAQARRIGHQLPIPEDSIAICSFGDASLNHSTAQGALNAAAWTAHQKLPVPVLFVCEDNNIGISVRTPQGWVERSVRARPAMAYYRADGLDLARGWEVVRQAVTHCRERREPVFLHMDVVRLLGHAGTDFEVEYRSEADIEASEARDPLLRSAELVMDLGLAEASELVDQYEAVRRRCFAAADRADTTPKLRNLSEVAAPLNKLDRSATLEEASRPTPPERRLEVFGSEARLPENQPPRHLAIQINRALHDLMAKYPESLLFGEDVAQKGGVYTVTRGLKQAFSAHRVFNTLLDEQTILGLAQGYGGMGMLPFPEIQYLAYFHNACDQIRGEACSTQFFSNGAFENPMVMRIASLGYQKGFGGHFHNDNSIAALRDIPGLIIGCPSRADDAVTMLRTLAATARVNGRVCAFLEPIALYMRKDLYAEGDGKWLFEYPAQGEAMPLGEPRIYNAFADQLVIVTYGNGVPMCLRAAARLKQDRGVDVRIVDLRWLLPLNEAAILEHTHAAARVLVVDEGRRSGGIAEAVLSLLAENGFTRPMARVTGADCYTPLAGAAATVLPSEDEVHQACVELMNRP